MGAHWAGSVFTAQCIRIARNHVAMAGFEPKLLNPDQAICRLLDDN